MTNIFNEDCLTGMLQLPNNSIDFILSDLPYGVVNYRQDKKTNLAEMWQQFKRILKPCAVVALFGSGRFSFELAASNFEQFKYKWIWAKNYATLFIHSKNRPMSAYEEILIFSDGVIAHENKSPRRMKYFPQGLMPATIVKANGNGAICLRNGKHKGDDRKKFGGIYHASPSNKIYRKQDFTGYPIDILYFSAPYNVKKFHPSEKPVDLLEYLIRTYTNEGETVLDACMGSGSTGVACVNSDRNFIGYEIDKQFFETAKSRIEQALREKAQRLF